MHKTHGKMSSTGMPEVTLASRKNEDHSHTHSYTQLSQHRKSGMHESCRRLLRILLVHLAGVHLQPLVLCLLLDVWFALTCQAQSFAFRVVTLLNTCFFHPKSFSFLYIKAGWYRKQPNFSTECGAGYLVNGLRRYWDISYAGNCNTGCCLWVEWKRRPEQAV